MGTGAGDDKDGENRMATGTEPQDCSFAELAARHDHDDMAKVLRGVPSQISFALEDPEFPAMPTGRFSKALVVGMGGSALPVDVLCDCFDEQLRQRLSVQRQYSVPADTGDDTLVIGSSFSGTTEETVSAIESLPADAGNVVIIAADTTPGAGQRSLATLARDRGYPWVKIPKDREPSGFQPRCATGYFVTYLARILAGAGLLAEPRKAFEDLVSFLADLDIEQQAEDTARWVDDRIPVVYTDDRHGLSVARVVKIKFNENAKHAAFFNVLPEANHNEMIGFRRRLGDQEFALLYIRDETSHPRIHERFEVMRSVFAAEPSAAAVFFSEWGMRGETALQRVFSALAFGDWCAYSLALLHGVNPTPVDLVEEFKRTLSPWQ